MITVILTFIVPNKDVPKWSLTNQVFVQDFISDVSAALKLPASLFTVIAVTTL